ncbi:FG-GAP repeat protein [Polyangium jinanense]|uniref:FG-GAP repeat protein n=2 Tax=Polyangium jinanense TaxID=2829994 RepID=A0A9X4AUD2_9BACT|nr:FG-GAP repeat protein [Polyangium jinanense]MDC3960907.1 FG-GAP repeat protein [Polyangium jinanense]MDC3984486.1 FG-GAP repeat protein [Polyangium jinanense]
MTWLFACGADSAPPKTEGSASAPPSTTESSASMPPALRAAYIEAVQRAAPEPYVAVDLGLGLIRAENDAQRFSATLGPSGILVSSREWSLAMRAAALGCEGALSPLPAAEPEAAGNRVRYRRERIEEWYLNGPLGLEQGFVLDEPPSCAGPKVIALELGGELDAELEDEDGDGRGEALRFVDSEGRRALAYTDLWVKDAQGKSLAAWLSVEAGRAAIHVEDEGALYPIVIDPLVWTQHAKLLPSDGAAEHDFGLAVALSGDTALVGAQGDDDQGSNSGSAYVFVRSGEVWTQQAKLLPSDGAADHHFGFSVALADDTALVGAYGDDDQGSFSGSAYVFVRSGAVWTQQAKLLPSDGATSDFFGRSVALSGDTALVGAEGNDDQGAPPARRMCSCGAARSGRSRPSSCPATGR